MWLFDVPRARGTVGGTAVRKLERRGGLYQITKHDGSAPFRGWPTFPGAADDGMTRQPALIRRPLETP